MAVLLVAGLTVGLVELRYAGQELGARRPAEPSILLAAAVTVAVTVPLVWRRRAPLTVLVLVAAVYTVSAVLLQIVHQVILVALWVTVYSASAYGARRWRGPVVAGAASVMWAANIIYSTAVNGSQPADGLTLGLYVANLHLHWPVWCAVAYALGRSVRMGRAREEELRVRTAELAAEREASARRAVLEERVRVARELHDVVAHHVSLMGVQAAAAGRVLTILPEQAAKALASIEVSSRQAVRELYRMLGFLRQDGEDDRLAPPPSLERLDSLIAQLPDAAPVVEVRVEGDRQPLPASVDLSAYRVVQEALTNILKHAQATTAAVTLRYRDGVLDVEVVDDGVGTAAVSPGENGRQRHGMIGMRERVVLHDGRFEAGPRAEGGFGVRASFPLGERS